MPENKDEASVLREIFEAYPDSILPNVNQPDHIFLNFHNLFYVEEFVTDRGIHMYKIKSKHRQIKT